MLTALSRHLPVFGIGVNAPLCSRVMGDLLAACGGGSLAMNNRRVRMLATQTAIHWALLHQHRMSHLIPMRAVAAAGHAKCWHDSRCDAHATRLSELSRPACPSVHLRIQQHSMSPAGDNGDADGRASCSPSAPTRCDHAGTHYPAKPQKQQHPRHGMRAKSSCHWLGSLRRCSLNTCGYGVTNAHLVSASRTPCRCMSTPNDGESEAREIVSGKDTACDESTQTKNTPTHDSSMNSTDASAIRSHNSTTDSDADGGTGSNASEKSNTTKDDSNQAVGSGEKKAVGTVVGSTRAKDVVEQSHTNTASPPKQKSCKPDDARSRSSTRGDSTTNDTVRGASSDMKSRNAYDSQPSNKPTTEPKSPPQGPPSSSSKRRGSASASSPSSSTSADNASTASDKDDDDDDDTLFSRTCVWVAFALTLSVMLWYVAQPRGRHTSWNALLRHAEELRRIDVYDHFAQVKLSSGWAHVGVVYDADTERHIRKVQTHYAAAAAAAAQQQQQQNAQSKQTEQLASESASTSSSFGTLSALKDALLRGTRYVFAGDETRIMPQQEETPQQLKSNVELPVTRQGRPVAESALVWLGTLMWIATLFVIPAIGLHTLRHNAMAVATAAAESAGGIRGGGGAGSGGVTGLGKAGGADGLFKLETACSTRFRDVAGMLEAKREISEIVDFLRTPEHFTRLGAQIPTGALLLGPPGTGKTLLARAVAGESEVGFIPVCGSDFMELYVGMGALRVRRLFEEARKQRCIIYIDEIDAIGLKRQGGGGSGGGEQQEREHTLNELLTQLDGFKTGTKRGEVMVLASTNAALEALDPALVRPGRFDRIIHVEAPVLSERVDIFKVHLSKLTLVPDDDGAEDAVEERSGGDADERAEKGDGHHAEPPRTDAGAQSATAHGGALSAAATAMPDDSTIKCDGSSSSSSSTDRNTCTMSREESTSGGNTNNTNAVMKPNKDASSGNDSGSTDKDSISASHDTKGVASIDPNSVCASATPSTAHPAHTSASAEKDDKHTSASSFSSSSSSLSATTTTRPNNAEDRSRALHTDPAASSPFLSSSAEFDSASLLAERTPHEQQRIAHDAQRMSQLCPGFVGADIANVCNEAAILAAREGAGYVSLLHLERSVDRVLAGVEHRSRVLSELERRIVAHHEAGHAVAGWFLHRADPLMKVSIIPRSGSALGYAQYLPNENRTVTAQEMRDAMGMTLGGRIAEDIFFDHRSTGAVDDLRKVTQMAYEYVACFADDGTEGTAGTGVGLGSVYPALGTDATRYHRPLAPSRADAQDARAKALVDVVYARTRALLVQHKAEMEALAQHLLKHEVILYADLLTYLGQRQERQSDLREPDVC